MIVNVELDSAPTVTLRFFVQSKYSSVTAKKDIVSLVVIIIFTSNCPVLGTYLVRKYALLWYMYQVLN